MYSGFDTEKYLHKLNTLASEGGLRKIDLATTAIIRKHSTMIQPVGPDSNS